MIMDYGPMFADESSIKDYKSLWRKKILIPETEMKITNNFFKTRFHEKNYEKITGPFFKLFFERSSN